MIRITKFLTKRIQPATSVMGQRLANEFSEDVWQDRGKAQENEYFHRKNKKKLKDLLVRLQGEMDDEMEADTILADRDLLISKLKRYNVDNDALVKELIRWKYHE